MATPSPVLSLDAPLRHPTRPTRGILWIGDPHLWSFKPGRRRDASFRDTVLGKIRQAAEISNALDLWPVFLGDLFHAPDDNDVSTLIALVRVLALFDRKPVTLEGNHDKNNHRLSEHNPLALLRETGQIEVIERSGAWAGLDLEGPDGQRHLAVLGGTPYGSPLPHSFREAFGVDRDPAVGTALWITHEDLAFEGAYPGSLPLEPMPGIDLVVNGHMHATKLPVQRDGTVFYNPGNITRMSVDQAEHIPAVWAWTPFSTETMASSTGTRVPRLERHILQHAPGADCFDFEGRHSRQAAAPATPQDEEKSLFVEIMKQQPAGGRTDDGEYARAALGQVLNDREAPEDVCKIATRICEEAIREHQASAR